MSESCPIKSGHGVNIHTNGLEDYFFRNHCNKMATYIINWRFAELLEINGELPIQGGLERS